MRTARKAAITATALATALVTSASFASAGVSPVQRVSPANLVAGCTAGAATGTLHPNTTTEPFVSVDPHQPRHAIVTWQQDRWSDGGSHAGGYAWTSDGVHYRQGVLPFGQCSGANDYHRISDLWVSFGPDGVAYSSALQFDENTPRSSVGGATSFDGGATWKYAQPMIEDNDPNLTDDKNSVTADQLHPGVAYQVWDRLDSSDNGFTGPALISITHDHGRTWTKPSIAVDTAKVAPFTQTIGNVIVEAPNGTLYDFFNLIKYTDATGNTAISSTYSMASSTDEGATWSAPTPVATDSSVAEVDPNNPAQGLRAGGGLEAVAVNPVTGKIWMTYEGSDFSGGKYDQIEMVTSDDHGATWTAPTLVSKPGVPAFTPVVAVDVTGTVSVSYYDLRYLTAGDTTTLPTARFLKVLPFGDSRQATERQLTPTFDWLLAPTAGGHMLGDYEGMASAGLIGEQNVFVASLNAPQHGTDVYSGVFVGPFSAAGWDGGTASVHKALPSHAAHTLNR